MVFFVFFDIFTRACASIGAATTRVLIDLGIGKSAITNWKHGSEPSNRTKKQIADYFGVSVDEFMDGKIGKKQDEPISQDTLREIIAYMRENEKAAAQPSDSLKMMNMFEKLSDKQPAVIRRLCLFVGILHSIFSKHCLLFYSQFY